MDGDIGKRLFALLEPKGILGLAFWDNGFKQMSANRPLRRVEDFKGLKMRIQSSKVLEAQMKALGANPQGMAFSEVYSALQQGVVDGTENPMSNLYTQKMHEVQKHLTLSDHGYLGYAVIVNRKFWEGLPADLRTTLEKTMQDATAYERDIAQKENDDALAAVRRAGTTEVWILPNEQRRKWWQVLLPVHKEFEDKIGRDFIQAAYAVAAQVEKEGKGRWPLVAVEPPLQGMIRVNRALDRLEEGITLSFMAAATLVTFVSVTLRYLFGTGFTWATELTIYLFIWMAKFGAAYGVRTGIHVGVDYVVNKAGPGLKRLPVVTGLLLGVVFTGVIAVLGARWVIFIHGTGQVSPDLEWPMWIIYLAIPLGSGLMCYRFLQGLVRFRRTGALPAHSMGVDDGEEAGRP